MISQVESFLCPDKEGTPINIYIYIYIYIYICVCVCVCVCEETNRVLCGCLLVILSASENLSRRYECIQSKQAKQPISSR